MVENFIETLEVENDMISIRVQNTEDNSKAIIKKPKTLVNSPIEKEDIYFESVVKLLKKFRNEVSILKRRTNEMYSTKKYSIHSLSGTTIHYLSFLKFRTRISILKNLEWKSFAHSTKQASVRRLSQNG